MRRHKSESSKNLIKKSYSSLRDFYDHLQKYPQGLQYKIGNSSKMSEIKVDLISSSSQSDHLVFHDPELCRRFANFRDAFFGDATYSIVPQVNGAYQCFILMGKKDGVVSFTNI